MELDFFKLSVLPPIRLVQRHCRLRCDLSVLRRVRIGQRELPAACVDDAAVRSEAG